GVGVGCARQEFEVLGVPFERRGRLTDDHLRAIRTAWEEEADYRSGPIPLWIGGNSDAALRRAVHLGDAWHPLRFRLDWLWEALDRLKAIADEEGRPVPALAPRIALRLTGKPVRDPARLAGEGTIDQIADDLDRLRLAGAENVLLDPFNGDPRETENPEQAWLAIAAVAANRP
ncbi:MAG: LLM class flavin-dependent oxidoreductase, partial [Nocardioidaceae bacterium]